MHTNDCQKGLVSYPAHYIPGITTNMNPNALWSLPKRFGHSDTSGYFSYKPIYSYSEHAIMLQ